MKIEDLTEAQIAWIIWNLQERLSNLLWDRYGKEFVAWAIDENYSSELDRILEKELDRQLLLSKR